MRTHAGAGERSAVNVAASPLPAGIRSTRIAQSLLQLQRGAGNIAVAALLTGRISSNDLARPGPVDRGSAALPERAGLPRPCRNSCRDSRAGRHHSYVSSMRSFGSAAYRRVARGSGPLTKPRCTAVVG